MDTVTTKKPACRRLLLFDFFQIPLLLLNFSHQCFIQLLFSWSHFLCYFIFFLLLLLFQEAYGVSINPFYFSLNPLIFVLPNISFFFPHICLFIQICFCIFFSVFFHFKLTFECFPHHLLVILLFLFLFFVNSSGTHFFFTFISGYHLIFFSLNAIKVC